MKESQAWRLIAKQRAEHPSRYILSGLCFQVMRLRNRGVITTPLAKWMLTRIMLHVPMLRRREAMHAYHHAESRRDTNAGRIMAAIWFALDAAAEENDA